MLLALIAIGIHTYLLVSQCCFSASGSDSHPDSFFSFIAVARSSSLLHCLLSCFPQGSNSHRPLLAPHRFIPVLVSPRLHLPPTLLLLFNPKRCPWKKTPQTPGKMPVSLFRYSEQLRNCFRLESWALWGRLKATFEQVKRLP